MTAFGKYQICTKISLSSQALVKGAYLQQHPIPQFIASAVLHFAAPGSYLQLSRLAYLWPTVLPFATLSADGLFYLSSALLLQFRHREEGPVSTQLAFVAVQDKQAKPMFSWGRATPMWINGHCSMFLTKITCCRWPSEFWLVGRKLDSSWRKCQQLSWERIADMWRERKVI